MLMFSVEFGPKALFGIKKSIEKTMLFIMGLDTYLFNLDMQMLIDHGSFQSVQMLWSLNWNKHTVLIIMQTSFIFSYKY